MIIPKGKWVTNQDGWIQTETGETITEYGGCGSHNSEFATEGVKALILAAPEMLAVIQELVSKAHETDVKLLKSGMQRGLWDRMAELAKRLEHTEPAQIAVFPQVRLSPKDNGFWKNAPLDATHYGQETNEHHASWYKQSSSGDWSCLAIQSSRFPGATWYGLGSQLSPERIAQLKPRPTEEQDPDWDGIVGG